MPVVGDWNGGGKSEVGVYCNGAWFRDYDNSHTWDAANQAQVADIGWAPVGTQVVTPVPGQWAGDGKTEMGVYCNGAWFLDSTGGGQWDGDHSYWGWSGSLIPVVGNWTGGTKSQFGVYSQGNWLPDYDNSHLWDAANQAAVTCYGWSGALPLVGNWGGGFADAARQAAPEAVAAQATASVQTSTLMAAQLDPAGSAAIARGTAARASARHRRQWRRRGSPQPMRPAAI